MKIITFLILLLFISFNCKNKTEEEIYYCPMHPTYTSDHPGNCPICNMTLVKQEKTKSNNEHDHSGTEDSNTMNMDSDTNAMQSDSINTKPTQEQLLTMSYEKQQSIGIVTDKVKRRDLNKTLNLYSNVAYDPDLYSALVEYKSARKSEEFFTEGEISNSSNLDLRLRQLGLSKEQIRLWTSPRRDPEELILGGKAGRGHIYSQIFETDLAIAKVGMKVEFSTEVYPNKKFTGQVKSIDTILDQNNRTLRLRSEVSDSSHLLKPQMFGQIKISIPKKNILSIPTSAIIDTGSMKMIYIKVSPDTFKPAQITTGVNMDNFTEVVSGVEEGADVVIESTFLIDSEAKIRFGRNIHKH